MTAQLNPFRKAFQQPTRQRINWFPGHMNKGMRQIQQKLRNVDCIVEIHDARIPLAGRNSQFFDTITGSGVKPHILVLNKIDLLGPKQQRSVTQQLRRQQPELRNILFTNCKDQRNHGVLDILPLATRLVADSSRYNRAQSAEHNIMIIGVPNVGKSSIINVLRNVHLKKRSAARVGAEAGVTRAVGERIKIQEKPAVYMIDTPGILQPSVTDDEMGMKLALVGCLPDHIVGEDLIADYLLYWLNKHRRFEYVEKLSLSSGPSDSISTVLAEYAHTEGLFHRVKQYDGQVEVMTNLLAAARKFIHFFRTGQLGSINLDEQS
ncbi:mitochondrial GTPase 1 [Drosophila guanche]|uniref:Mitochondrial GTPase 1 n=1 Tax=Drosophila guanche TaxID=7266 RepID=A0A3B0JLA3_DROGU|nr:mitochondrial GTPase 1 [Drosophila guanche]SPP83005.1 blast:Mitochondrial GTPase 1 [Drosophila guanche]